MGKLIKYEFRKQLMTKLVICFFLALFEIIFLLGVGLEKENMMSFGSGFLFMTGWISFAFLGFEAVITYSNDLKTKQSYMLFLVPRNAYEIVGAKMITMIVQVAAAGAAFAGLAALDVVVLCARFGKINEMLEGIKEFVKMVTGSELRMMDFIWVFAMMLVLWLVFVTMAIFAITLATTLFANKRWKGVVSFLIYLVLNFGIAKIANLLLVDKFLQRDVIVADSAAWRFILFYSVVMVLDFLGTAFLLEKKVSV